MNYTKIIPIDPGLSGGIVVYSIPNKSIYSGGMPVICEKKQVKDRKSGETKEKIKRETDVGSIARLIDEHKKGHKVLVVIEKVSSRPQDLEDPGKIFNIQKMLSNYNSLITVLKLSDVDYIEVTPRVWQKALRLGKDKNKNKLFAQQNYPMIKSITLKTSDAICILHFARLKLKTDPKWIEERLKNQETGLI